MHLREWRVDVDLKVEDNLHKGEAEKLQGPEKCWNFIEHLLEPKN